MDTPEDAQELLDFWFDAANQTYWFEKNEDFDARLKARFAALREAAESGALDHWANTPKGALALILLLDQLPRNFFRGDARAFATDAKARAVARTALDAGFDAVLREEMGEAAAMFCYLPLEHSEDLADQEECVGLMAALPSGEEWVKYAEAHRVIIERFGRFPHRNEALGRQSTPEELAFLKEPNSSF